MEDKENREKLYRAVGVLLKGILAETPAKKPETRQTKPTHSDTKDELAEYPESADSPDTDQG